MARLTDHDRDRERRLQQLLLERISLKAERRLAREIATTTRKAVQKWQALGQVDIEPEHERRIDVILKGIWRDSAEALGGRIFQMAKNARAPAKIKQSEDFFAGVVSQYLEQFGGDKIVSITNTTRAQILEQIASGREEGLGEKEIAKRISTAAPSIGRVRAAVISRTESHAAGNFAAQESAKRTEAVTQREWLASGGGRTRDSHRSADGQVVGMDEPFRVGGANLMYPGDPSGPADEVINCRCAIGYIVE